MIGVQKLRIYYYRLKHSDIYKLFLNKTRKKENLNGSSLPNYRFIDTPHFTF